MSTLTFSAALALGFGLGVLATGVLLALLGAIALFGWWRFCQAFERAGFDLKLHAPEPEIQ